MLTVLPAIWVTELDILNKKKSVNETLCELDASHQVTRVTNLGPVRSVNIF